MAWLSLAEEDDDPARFCRQLIEALGEAVPQLGDDAQTYLQNTMRVPVVAVIESLLGDLDRYARPLLLVLDDLHLVSNPDIFTGLNRLVQYAPPGLVLALGTRSQPALSLATWRAKGLLLEIGLEELRLGFEETREYLERSGLYLDEPCLKALYGQTEGWVVGVHLVSLWLRQQPQVQEMALLDGDKQAVSAYLLAAVFERLPGDLQEALLALGVASQLSGDLANALTGRQDGQALLERLSPCNCSSCRWIANASGIASTCCSPTSSATACATPIRTVSSNCISTPACGSPTTTCRRSPSSMPVRRKTRR